MNTREPTLYDFAKRYVEAQEDLETNPTANSDANVELAVDQLITFVADLAFKHVITPSTHETPEEVLKEFSSVVLVQFGVIRADQALDISRRIRSAVLEEEPAVRQRVLG